MALTQFVESRLIQELGEQGKIRQAQILQNSKYGWMFCLDTLNTEKWPKDTI